MCVPVLLGGSQKLYQNRRFLHLPYLNRQRILHSSDCANQVALSTSSLVEACYYKCVGRG